MEATEENRKLVAVVAEHFELLSREFRHSSLFLFKTDPEPGLTGLSIFLDDQDDAMWERLEKVFEGVRDIYEKINKGTTFLMLFDLPSPNEGYRNARVLSLPKSKSLFLQLYESIGKDA